MRWREREAGSYFCPLWGKCLGSLTLTLTPCPRRVDELSPTQLMDGRQSSGMQPKHSYQTPPTLRLEIQHSLKKHYVTFSKICYVPNQKAVSNFLLTIRMKKPTHLLLSSSCPHSNKKQSTFLDVISKKFRVTARVQYCLNYFAGGFAKQLVKKRWRAGSTPFFLQYVSSLDDLPTSCDVAVVQ